MRSLRLLSLGLGAAIALTGCASPDAGTDGPVVPSATSTDAGPAEQERETGLTRPAMVFGGDCDAVFSDAELASVMGESLTLGNNHFSELWGGDALFNQNGGFECTWGGQESRVIALVLPEAAVEYTPKAYECSDTHDSYALSCTMESVVNGIRLSGLSTLGQDPAAAVSARDALLAIFAEKAAKQTPVPVPLPAIGSWILPPDCVGIASGADFSAVPGLGAGTTDGGVLGAGKDVTQAEEAIAPGWFPKTCSVQGESVMVEYVPVGGSRWREDEIAARADASPLTLTGVEAAYAVPFDDGRSIVYAFSGPNMLAFTVRYPKNAAGIATTLFASLDATAVR